MQGPGIIRWAFSIWSLRREPPAGAEPPVLLLKACVFGLMSGPFFSVSRERSRQLKEAMGVD